MSKIGLLTLYGRNYGSALQCYAMKKTVEKLGYECVLLQRSYSGTDKYLFYLTELARAGLYTLAYRGFLKNYMIMRRAGKQSIAAVSEKSAFALDLFARATLQPHKYSYADLRAIAAQDDYKFFITGSDQVWSGARIADKCMFLRFATEIKRIAYAPSFGSEKIMRFNCRSFAKYIREIPRLSAREESGRKNIYELTGRACPCLPDPVFLLTADEWRRFANASGEKYKYEHGYILAHFLDEPSDTALKTLKDCANNTGLKILCFAYPHKSLLAMTDCVMIDGAPENYIRLIDNADYVFTDSFHTSVFSILLSSRFYVFDRQYRHGASQRTRIEQLLNCFSCTERFISSPRRYLQLPQKIPDCSGIIAVQREKGLGFLLDALGSTENIKSSDINTELKNETECCGCGACAAICPQNAISMLPDAKGCRMPSVDAEKCVKCGLCAKICHVKISYKHEKPEAYACFNTDSVMCEKSASGGAFSAFATCILDKGGVVFGAELSYDGGSVHVSHVMIDRTDELYRILNSKYVESDCMRAYIQAKAALAQGRCVLFSGTSCQIDGLYRYLGKDQVENLYTLDLICHGVPGAKLFDDYIAMLEKRYSAAVTDFSFRTKRGAVTEYTEKLVLRDGSVKYIPWKKSPYFRMFLAMESYRDSCYSCRFASIHKPADITAGDFFELASDYPEVSTALGAKNGVSCLLVRSKKGRELLHKAEGRLRAVPISLEAAQFSHMQLCAPPTYSDMRNKLFEIYKKSGMTGLQRWYRARDALFFLQKLLLKK